jgi:hypothetical protein
MRIVPVQADNASMQNQTRDVGREVAPRSLNLSIGRQVNAVYLLIAVNAVAVPNNG